MLFGIRDISVSLIVGVGSGIAGDVRRDCVGRSGATGAVDDVLDHADAPEGHGEEVVEVHARCVWCFERVVADHRQG
jgi:hypothetical protein